MQQQIKNLGNKYIPELHTPTDGDFVMHALLGDHEFLSKATARLADFSSDIAEFRSAISAISSETDPQFGHNLQKSARLLQKPTQALETAYHEVRGQIRSYASRDRIRLALATVEAAKNQLTESLSTYWEDTAKEILDAEAEVQSSLAGQEEKQRFERLRRIVREPGSLYESRILGHLAWLSEQLTVQQKGVIHLIGGAGAGKTHLLAQTCSDLKVAAIFLRGISFSNLGTIQTQILGQLNLHVSWGNFIAALNIYEKAFGHRVLIAIDALSEAGDITLWERELAGFQHELSKYENIALVTSCRESYKPAIWKNPPGGTTTFCWVSGFDESELRTALPKYFAYYKILATITLESRRQFANPLYLRIFCQAQNRDRTDFKQVFLGRQSLFSVFELYLDSVNESFSRRVGHPPQVKALPTMLRQFALELWNTNARSLPFEKTLRLFADRATPWDSSCTKALLDEELILNRSYFLGEERCEFGYDLLGGYLIAKEILAQLPSVFRRAPADEATKLVEPILERLTDRGSDLYHPLHEDILRSLAALFPARAGRHLAYVPCGGAVAEAGVDAFFEMDPGYVGPHEKQTVTDLFMDSELRLWLIGRLSETALSPNHPLNADFLTILLSALSMADRDLCWSEYLRDRPKAIKDTIDEFVQACLSTPHTSDHRKQLSLAAEYLSWVLTSNDPHLRDNATLALVLFGQGAAETLFQMTEKALTCNDPYVPERMLAAAYGTAMRLHCRPGELNFRDQVLPRFAQNIYNLMFADHAPFATTHSLSRDYGKHIIDLALYYHKDILTPSETKRVAPPFDGGIRNWRTQPDYDADKYRDGNDPLGFDWGNYTMGSLARGRSTYDYNHPDFLQVKGQILWRIHDLGYSLERFGKFDQEIFRSQWHQRDHSDKPDRYGEKYSWIAFHELHGYRKDTGLLPKKDWLEPSPHSDEADIDPSFPGRGHECQILTDDILGNAISNPSQWVNKGPIPNFKRYLYLESLQNETGPWLALFVMFTARDASFHRNAYARARAFLANEENLKKARKFLRAGKLRLLNLGKLPEVRGLFAGELAWHRDFEYTRIEKYNIPIGTSRVLNKEKPVSLNVNLGETVLNIPIVRHTKWRTVPTYDTLRLESPMLSSYLSNRSPLDRPSGEVLSRQLCERFGLWLNLPYWDMRDPRGQRITIATNRGQLGSHEGSMYMRLKNLELYLKENSLRLIWIVDGERQELITSGFNAGYKQYELLYAWENGRIKRL